MRVTATQLVTYWICPFLWHVSYEVKEPLPVWGTRRRFGNVIHAAIAEYERHGRSLERAILILEKEQAGLSHQDLVEARSILAWRHGRPRPREAHPFLVEGPLSASIAGHRLAVRMDRLDRVGEGYLLAEVKAGREVDLRLVTVQLSILAYAVWSVLGQAPIRWQLELLRSRNVLEVEPVTDPGRLTRLTADLVRSVARADHEPKPYDETFCRKCPARRHCPRWTPHPKPFTPLRRESPPQLQLIWPVLGPSPIPGEGPRERRRPE
jgi:RecB family exonuclease